MKNDEYENARESYFSWLCMISHMDSDDSDKNSYFTLARILNDTVFYSPVSMDNNRIQDVFNLRSEWTDRMVEAGYFYPDDALNMPCSVFEVMVALANRYENQVMWDPDYGNRTYIWFNDMLNNFLVANGLTRDYVNDDVINMGTEITIRNGLETLLDRTYEFNGYGGFFPLHYSRRDQTKIELWSQMSQYMVENYKF